MLDRSLSGNRLQNVVVHVQMRDQVVGCELEKLKFIFN